MFIKYLDYLSPRVTFYYQGNLSHTSIISGIISIVAIVFLIILSVYFSLDIIQKSNPNTFFFNSFVEDSGTYYLNKTSLFHFVKIIQNIRGNEIHEDFDFTTFNIIGAQAHIDNFINNDKRGGLKTFDHWVYGNCNKNNTEGLDDLIKFDFFEKSACVIKYFNCTEGKYYSIDEPNFAWPRIAHGTFNDLNKLYGLYVQKCSDDILYQILGDGYNCKNDSEIDYYFDSLRGGRIMHFYFVNNYINILDYDNPINKFIYRMETPLYKEQYSTNSININPVLVRTHNGLILDNIKDDVTYMLDRNDVYISERKGANMYMGYCFFLKNNNEYYERTYKRIQEVISSIGGINQAITIIAIYLNYLYNNYVVLSDTEMLLHSLIHTEKKNHRKKSIELRNLNNRIKETPKEKKINSNDIKKSSDQRKFGETIDNRAKKNKTENNISYTKDQLNNKVEDLTMDNGELGKRKNFEKMKTFKDYDRYKSEKSFCNYLCFFISCSKKKRFFKVYQDFRIKIISEEHLIRNHLNIYNLLKITEKKRHIRRNSYHLDDLMNLV
jgi:hypothetical protein